MSATPMPRNSTPRVGDLLGHLQVRVEGKRKSDDSAKCLHACGTPVWRTKALSSTIPLSLVFLLIVRS
jgi:hypothetical protein